MRTKIIYEWDLELSDGNEVLDHSHFDTCPGLPTEKNVSLVLIRDVWECDEKTGEPDDLEDRSWAYIKDGKLPKTFDDGFKVPQRFHKELEKANG